MKYFLLIPIFLLILSCSNEKQEQQSNVNASPSTLIEESDEISISRLSKSYRDDIVSRLYDEALDKDPRLRELDNEINFLQNDSLSDKTKTYDKYERTNSEYWNTAKKYASGINDSITRTSTIELLEKFTSEYEKTIQAHENKMGVINRSQLELSDQVILMKLFVTLPMIKNYQRNELPDIKELESLIKDYQKVLEKSEDYTRINK